MELAKELGVDDYPSPASGCLLTDPGYSRRLKDLMDHEKLTKFADFNLLRVGRHFRLDEKTKAIVGRDESDNHQLLGYKEPHHIRLEARGVGSPITVLVGEASDENLRKAAQLTARYSNAKKQPEVTITVTENGSDRELVVAPAEATEIGAVLVN
jgi:predicted ribosome quality control (RQC) complex YloA/Tae2 family protein